MKPAHSSHPFLESALVGAVATVVGQLGVGAALDPVIGDYWANLVGLILEAAIDYVGQHYVLLGGAAPNKTQTERFVVSKAITIAFSQILFILLLPSFLRVAKKVKRMLSSEWIITLGRIFVNAITFVALTYPLRKHWVFSPNTLSQEKDEVSREADALGTHNDSVAS